MKIVVSSKIKAKAVLITSLVLIFSVLTTGVIYVWRKEAALTASLSGKTDFIVVIDAGHGGIDGGTQSANGILEKDINLQIALKLRDILESFGIKTVMTRETDVSIHSEGVEGIRNQKVSDINNRYKIIEETPDALFVSIHQNYFTQEKYSGAQVFYSGNNPESEKLALAVRSSIIMNQQKGNTREIKKSGSEIYLLKKASVPAIMLECGFLSNAKEAELLQKEEYQQQIAFFTALGIIDYINSTE